MDDIERSIARQWLRTMRGDQSQAELVADITATTGWTITRDRYSKYESGSPIQPMGRGVFQHFVDYWTAKGRPAPDMTPPAPELSLEERAVVAAERQADAIGELLGSMAARLDAAERRAEAAERRAEATEALIATLTAPAIADPTALEAMRAWGRGALDRSRSRAQRPEPLRATE